VSRDPLLRDIDSGQQRRAEVINTIEGRSHWYSLANASKCWVEPHLRWVIQSAAPSTVRVGAVRTDVAEMEVAIIIGLMDWSHGTSGSRSKTELEAGAADSISPVQ